MRPFFKPILLTATICVTAFSCSSTQEITTDLGQADSAEADSGVSDSGKTDASPGVVTLDPALFIAGALAKTPELVDCELGNGTMTKCYEIVTLGKPAGQDVGPFCPPNISSAASEGGVWFDGDGGTVDLDGSFFKNAATFYNDDKWKLFDETSGDIFVTNTQASCEGAAQPNVEAEFQNHCVECAMDYIDGGISVSFLIPATPTPAAVTGGMINQVGVSLNGVELSGPAPVDAILGNYTIAAFDDCGGHINVHQGYHYHAATGCTEVGLQEDDHAALLGYALDGYGIYGMRDGQGEESTGLDECRGHEDEVRGYHYHAASAGENMFIGCFHGEIVGVDGPPGGGPPGGE